MNEIKRDMHSDLLGELHKLYIIKNEDYGDSVHETYERYGLVSFLVRMEDKLNRVKTLSEKGTQSVANEKTEDSLIDLANYALLAIMELRMHNLNKCYESTDENANESTNVIADNILSSMKKVKEAGLL